MNESFDPVASDPTPSPDESAPRWPVLDPVTARILGCLIEKAATTPDYYPLTLNALTNACNQKSNRDPVMLLGEDDVANGLDTLRIQHRLAAQVHTAGSRVEKFKHTLAQVIPVTPPQAAILCELLVRGPQTAGELRTRAARIHPFAGLEEVAAALDELAHHPDGALVVKLPREPGRREARWAHVLCGQPDLAEIPESRPSPARVQPVDDDLREEVRQLRLEVEALKAKIESLTDLPRT